MGFRSTFTTTDLQTAWPDWFVAKYSDSISFGNDGKGALGALRESTTYGRWPELDEDIQKAINWDEVKQKFVVVYLHECGGVSRVIIYKDTITLSEPDGWIGSCDKAHHCCQCLEKLKP